jgi:hypothetical protein
LTESKTQGLDKMTKSGHKKRGKRSVCDISIETDSQNTKEKKIKESKNEATMMMKTSRTLSGSTVVAQILEVQGGSNMTGTDCV